jgi:hypothetical protein
MPAAVAIDWAGIRANAVSMGIRAAARAAAADLSPNEQERFVFRVLKRAQREKWEESKAKAVSAVVVRNEKPLSSKVLNGSEAAAVAIANEGERTRTGLAISARKAAESAALKNGEELLNRDTSQAVRNWAGVASTVYGWEAKKDEGAKVMINIGILNE